MENDLFYTSNALTMRSTPTSEHARFLEFTQTLCHAQSWLLNWLAGGLTLALCT